MRSTTVAGSRLVLPEGAPRAFAAFVHDLADETAARIGRTLTEAGIGVLIGSRDLASAAADLGSVSLLIGHGNGGPVVLEAAHRIPAVKAVATIGAPMGPVDMPAALLVVHSPVDEVVPIDNARRLYGAARHPKSFLSLDGASHRLTDPADATFAATMIATWASRYLPPAPSTTGDRSVVVTENDDVPFGQRITAGRHVLTADEPRPAGWDTGPNPYELLLASLGACTSMTIRMYAERKGWPLRQVTVTLRHSRVHAKDCEKCETEVGMLDRIDRSVRLEGSLTEDQRGRLMEIADKCPVHRTLHSEIDVRTSLE
jgi:uncharacterized OsmC-like protein